jgi:hypothetical protein
VQPHPYLNVYLVGQALKNYKPQMSHFLVGFLRFSPAIWLLLCSQTSFKQLETNNNNVHILASRTEKEAVHSGQTIHPKMKILPTIPKRQTNYSFGKSVRTSALCMTQVILPTIVYRQIILLIFHCITISLYHNSCLHTSSWLCL